MKIHIKQKNEAVLFEATNENGVKLHIDGPPSIGGQNQGFRPMELVASAAATCSSMDLLLILKKQKQPIENLEINITATRRESSPKIFTDINFQFIIHGLVDEKKAAKAVKLSIEKYCSVILSLNSEINISSSFLIQP